jgi:trimeric autotransporter adhesin
VRTEVFERQLSSGSSGAAASTVILVGLLLFLRATPADAQVVDSALWGTDGSVEAVARSGNSIYIGGAFSLVGPSTGGGVPVSNSNGEPIRPFPAVTGYIFSVAPDGEGGWYIGGDFRAVGGIPRTHLAHILADGRLANWAPKLNGQVVALAVRGQNIYVGGVFTEVGSQERRYIADIDAQTGLATKWNPRANLYVRALAIAGNTLYAGGEFDSIGGQARDRLAAMDLAFGNVTPWNPDANNAVYSLALDEGAVLAGGEFTLIGGQPRNRIASIDARTGLATAWDPNADGPTVIEIGQRPAVYALSVAGRTVYAGGNFLSIGGKARNALAALDATTGLATDWNPNPGGDGSFAEEIYSIEVTVRTVKVGGLFTTMGGQLRNYAAELDAKSGGVTNWNPRPSGSVRAIAAHDDIVYLGGTFTTIWDWQPRRCLAAIDATTGAVAPWDPNQNGYIVTALAVSGSTVFVGGTFDSIGGQNRVALAAVDGVSGKSKGWRADADGPVLVLVARGNNLYAGGNFNSIGGKVRNHLAALDVTTAAIGDWDPKSNGSVFAIAMSGNTIYVGGLFSRMGGPGGQTRKSIAALDGKTGAATPWNPNCDLWVDALAVSGNVVYAAGRFDSIGGAARNNIAALDTSSGATTSWNPDADGEVYALAAAGNTVYAGGWFENIGEERRFSIAGLAATTGLATAWDAKGDRIVHTLSLSGDQLYAGGIFGSMDLIPCTNLASISVPAQFARSLDDLRGHSIAMEPVTPNPARQSATIRFSLSTAAAVNLRIYDLEGRRVATLLDHDMRLAGEYEVPIRTSAWRTGYYFCRLQAGSASVTRKILVLQ